jgi:hypothetical protein
MSLVIAKTIKKFLVQKDCLSNCVLKWVHRKSSDFYLLANPSGGAAKLRKCAAEKTG